MDKMPTQKSGLKYVWWFSVGNLQTYFVINVINEYDKPFWLKMYQEEWIWQTILTKNVSRSTFLENDVLYEIYPVTSDPG